MNDESRSESVSSDLNFASAVKFWSCFIDQLRACPGSVRCGFLFALTFFTLAASVSAQPAMSRGEQRLSISYDECMRRAGNAFTNEGWVNIGQGGAFVNAFKENHGAYIMCNVAPENKTWVNIVVASLSRDTNAPGAERVKLQRWMEQSASSTSTQNYPGLAGGSWKSEGNPGCEGFIQQNGQELSFKVCQYQSKGRFVDGRTIVADEWGVRGTISADYKRIDWTNGNVWTRP